MGRVKLKKSCLYFALTLLVAGCVDAAGSKSAAQAGRDPNASTVIAEIALERGDCRTAAETYAAAAQRGDVGVARRASEVSLACEHLPAAWGEIATRCFEKNLTGESVIVTGPSRTADIEKLLILGVHGPKRLVVLLVG